MKEAFLFMFKDNMLKQKALIYFLFAFIANFLTQWSNLFVPSGRGESAPIQYYILIILACVVSFIPSGYGISCIKSLLEQKENPVLPFLNIKNNFVLGFKFAVNIMLISLVFGLAILMLLFPFALIYAFGYKILSIILLFVVVGLFVLFISFYSPVLCCIFAKKEWFTTYFRFIRATKIIKQDFWKYFKYVMLFIAIMIVISVINYYLMLLINSGIWGAALIAFVIALISSYTVFINAYICARAVNPESIE